MKQFQNRQKMMVKPRESAEKYLLKGKKLSASKRRMSKKSPPISDSRKQF